MAFFNSTTPVYKTAASPKVATYAPQASQGWLSGIFGSLFTGAVPSYKTAPPPVSTAPIDDTADGGDADDACAAGSPTSETIVVL